MSKHIETIVTTADKSAQLVFARNQGAKGDAMYAAKATYNQFIRLRNLALKGLGRDSEVTDMHFNYKPEVEQL